MQISNTVSRFSSYYIERYNVTLYGSLVYKVHKANFGRFPDVLKAVSGDDMISLTISLTARPSEYIAGLIKTESFAKSITRLTHDKVNDDMWPVRPYLLVILHRIRGKETCIDLCEYLLLFFMIGLAGFCFSKHKATTHVK